MNGYIWCVWVNPLVYDIWLMLGGLQYYAKCNLAEGYTATIYIHQSKRGLWWRYFRSQFNHWLKTTCILGLSLLRPMYYEYPENPEAYTFNKQVGLAMGPLMLGLNLYNFSISLGLTYWLLQLPPQWTTTPASVAKVCGFQRFVKGWESKCE